MGVPHFYTWLINRYPLVKSSYNPSTLPLIDWLFIDLNAIIYKCALDESSAFKDVLKGKKFEDIFIQIFNYVNEISQLIQPQKMLFLALDGVAPRAKMNQQRSRRFKSAKKYQDLDNALRSLGILEKEEHFKNNSVSPGTEFMYELNRQIKFLIQRKMKEDERWRKISVVFSGVDVPGEGEHKILEYIRRKSQQNGFNPNTTMCFYGSDADFIMLALTAHLPFLCILRERSTPRPRLTPATKRQQQQTLFDFLWINVLREYFEAEFGSLRESMGDRYNVDRVIDDFVFLGFVIGNDFLPRVFCMDIKTGNFDKVIQVFKETLAELDGYINNKGVVAWQRAVILFKKIAQFELKFMEDKLEEQQMQQKFANNYKKVLEEVDTITIQSNKEVLLEVKELKEEYEELERLEQEEELSMSSDSEGENPAITRIKKVTSISTPRKKFPRKPGKTSFDFEGDLFAEDFGFGGVNDSNSYDSTSKSYTGDNNNVFAEDEIYKDKKSDQDDEEEDKRVIKKQSEDITKGYIDEYLGEIPEVFPNNPDPEVIKLEEAENYLLTYSNEETVLRLLSARALENDIKFMTSLVKAYRQNINEARKYFYEEKFGININQPDMSELAKVLIYYMQGLQYVLSYYYTNSPSWDWYYPYHYSPLISDLANMMKHLNLTTLSQTLLNFRQGKPFDPFKQLLMILPLTSMHLLPEGFRSIVSNPECCLYKYYPTEFQIDPFGAVFDSEYIAKIPFVDESILEPEYQRILKEKKFTKSEILRNTIGTNLIYEWNPKIYEYEVESTLPLYFDKFRVRIKISQFSMEDLAFDPTKILDRPPQGTYKYHRSFPCLNFIQEKKIEMKDHIRKSVTFSRCCIRLGQRLNLTEYKQYRKLLDQPFYCMYPFLLPCFVMGIVTPDQLITNVPYQELPFMYKKAFHRDYYMSLNASVHDFYFSQMGILFKESLLYFALIYLESEVRKDSLGNIYPLKPRIEAIPLNFLIDTNIMPKYRGKIDYNPKDLGKEFPMHSEIVINIGPTAGSLARVVGYASEAADFDNVEVKIVKTPPKLGAVTAAISAKYDDHRNYRSVYHVAKKLGVDIQVVLTVLDCLIIKTEASLNTKSLYPERFDIGLNLIHRKNHTIVAELVICNELQKQRRKSHRTFPHFQLAPEAINLLKDYYANHKAVFEAISNKIRLGDPSPLTAKFVFPNAEDPNLEAFKIYIWILKQENSNLSLTNKASKVIPREGIRELEKVLGGSKNYLGEQAKHILNKVFPYNPNFLIPKSTDYWVPPFYSKQPPWHKLGDRVVNLKVNGSNFAPFGAVGTVVGILGNKPENGLWKVKIEILFDYPFIGGSNLGGRCSWGRGAVVNFDEIFNLRRWEKCIKERDPRRIISNPDWDGVFPSSYVPSFQTASEISDTEDDNVRTNQPNIPTNPVLQEDLIKILTDKEKEARLKAEKREQSKKKNKNNRTQNKPYKRPDSPQKPSIVPKTLGLRKSEDHKEGSYEEIPSSSKTTQVESVVESVDIAIRNPSPDSQNKMDFNTLINNTMPPVMDKDAISSTSFSMSSRFSIGNPSIPEIPSQSLNRIRPAIYNTWIPNSEVVLEESMTIFNMEAKTPNMPKSQRVEVMKKIGDRRNTIGVFADFGYKGGKDLEKKDIKKGIYDFQRQVENNDTEDGGMEQILIEVSQGGRLVKEAVTLGSIDEEIN